MTITAEIPPLTPEKLAELFWQLSDTEQARFFGTLGACALATPCSFSNKVGSYFPLDFQMYMASTHCTGNGLRVMQIMGDQSSGMPDRLQPYFLPNQTMPPTKKGQPQQ